MSYFRTRFQFPWPGLGETALAASLLGVFLTLQFVDFNRPGALHDGLILDQYLAAQILDMLKQRSFLDIVISGDLPADRGNYHSTVMAYFFLPFLRLFGPSWALVKIFPVGIALGSLLFTYFFQRQLFGRGAALVILALLAVHPTYVMGIRASSVMLSHMHFFSMGTLFFLAHWWSSRRPMFLFAGLFWLGLGLGTQLWFLWFAGGLLGSFFLLFPYVRARLKRARAVRETVLGVCGLFLGASLVIYRDVVNGFKWIPRVIGGGIAGSQNPLNPGETLFAWPLIDTLNAMLDGSLMFGFLFNLPHLGERWVPPPPNTFYPVLFWAATGLCAYLAVASRTPLKLPARAVVSVFALMLLCALISRTDISKPRELHLFFLYPFPQMLLGIATAWTWETTRRTRWLRIFVAAGFFFIGKNEVESLCSYFRQMRATGGSMMFSDALYDLSAWLAETRADRAWLFFFKTDRGELPSQLYFLQPSLRPRYVLFGRHDPPDTGIGFAKGLSEHRTADALIIENPYNRSLWFPLQKWAESRGLRFEKVREFVDDGGTVIYKIYRVPASTETAHALERLLRP